MTHDEKPRGCCAVRTVESGDGHEVRYYFVDSLDDDDILFALDEYGLDVHGRRPYAPGCTFSQSVRIDRAHGLAIASQWHGMDV